MKYFYLYDSNGKIKSATMCSDLSYKVQITPAGCTRGIGEPDVDNDYVKDGKITARPKMAVSVDKTTILANETDKATITGIPKGTRVYIMGDDEGICDDGKMEILADFKGTYKVKLVCWPYLDKEIEINAVDNIGISGS